MRDNANFGGVFRRHEGFQKWLSRFLKTPKTIAANAAGGACGGASGRLRAEGVSGERGAAERGGASDQLRARGRGGEQRALVPHALPGGFGNGPDSDAAWAAHKGRAARTSHPPSCLAV